MSDSKGKADSKHKNSPIGQIIVAGIVTLLIGGTAPWWWHEIFPGEDNPPPSPPPTPSEFTSSPPTATPPTPPSPTFSPTLDPVPSPDRTETPSSPLFENDFMTMELTNIARDGNSVSLVFTIKRKDQDFYIGDDYNPGESLILDELGRPICSEDNRDYLLLGLRDINFSYASSDKPDSYNLVDSTNPALVVSWSGSENRSCRDISDVNIINAHFDLVRLETSGGGTTTTSRFSAVFPNIRIP